MSRVSRQPGFAHRRRGRAHQDHRVAGERPVEVTLPDALMERLATLEEAVVNLDQGQADSIAAMGEVTDRLEKQLSRAGKELFKANALADAQQKGAETMLAQLRDAAAHRERELAQMREQLGTAHEEGRLDVVRRLLPAIDGLEEALASGRRLQRATPIAPPETPSFLLSLLQRLNPALRTPTATETSPTQAISAWLEGLQIVHERLLEALAAVEVAPIPAEGGVFDPHLHIALETVAATDTTPAGTIVREHRRGYVRGDTVLRYAEVIVARIAVETEK